MDGFFRFWVRYSMTHLGLAYLGRKLPGEMGSFGRRDIAQRVMELISQGVGDFGLGSFRNFHGPPGFRTGRKRR